MDHSRSGFWQGVRVVFIASALFAMVSCGGDDSSSSSSNNVTVVKINLTPTNSSIGIGEKQVFTALPSDANGNTVGVALTWTSSNTSVATVDTIGTATGVGQGTTTITATDPSSGVASNTASLAVTAKIASISISPMSDTVAVGGTKQFTATALDSSGKEIPGVVISWFCSFSGVATINGSGLVTGVSPGTVTIVASSGSVSSQPAVLTVTK